MRSGKLFHQHTFNHAAGNHEGFGMNHQLQLLAHHGIISGNPVAKNAHIKGAALRVAVENTTLTFNHGFSFIVHDGGVACKWNFEFAR